MKKVHILSGLIVGYGVHTEGRQGRKIVLSISILHILYNKEQQHQITNNPFFLRHKTKKEMNRSRSLDLECCLNLDVLFKPLNVI